MKPIVAKAGVRQSPAVQAEVVVGRLQRPRWASFPVMPVMSAFFKSVRAQLRI